jgi:hypothetical protein
MKVFDETIQVPESELFFHHEIPQKEQHGCINRDSEKNLEVLRSIGCTPLKVKERTVSYKKAVLSHFSLYSEREDIISRLKLLKSTILNFGLSNFLMGLLDP